MVHKKRYKKKLKMDFEILDKMAQMMGWKLDKKGVERTYFFDGKKILLRKVVSGYKVILIKNKKIYDSDVMKNLDEARLILGENLMFRGW